jgi:bifunctional non-homologous end joining protein LigD
MKPMLATLVQEPFDSAEWIFEKKFDGYRCLAHKNKTVQLLSRNNISFNSHFPELVKEVQSLPGPFVIDGEIVILDKNGDANFQLLQNYKTEKTGTPYYYIFDILSYKERDLTQLPLTQRREVLQALLKKKPSKHLCFSKAIDAKGEKLYKKAQKEGWEGIIAKRKESPYQPSRSRDWLKIKTHLRQEFVIGGYTAPRGSREKFGSLLVGVYQKGKLLFAGHVGGGFNRANLGVIYKKLQKHITSVCPFSVKPKPNAPVVWVKPKLVCEVTFAEWTQSGCLRQPIFQGLRSDKPADQVVREQPL